MTLQQIIYKPTRPYPLHSLSVSLSLFSMVAVGLDWCWKEYSKQFNYSHDGFQRQFYRLGHAFIAEGCLFDEAFFNADR